MTATLLLAVLAARPPAFEVREDAERVTLRGPALAAGVRKAGYVSGVEAGSLLDVRTGTRDRGFGLAVADWLAEPGSDAAYRDALPAGFAYPFNDLLHGRRAKRLVEGPQICTGAKTLGPRVVTGDGFAAVTQGYTFTQAAPGRAAGSRWEQTLVFPAGERYFLAAEWITSANAADDLFFRLDLPGHIRHTAGDTFTEVYLSYHGTVPATEFHTDFAPDERFLYVRDDAKVPRRMIRAYRTRDPKTGAAGPWLAGMTLDPGAVSEAWCHQRAYVCLIQEVGGRPVAKGGAFGAAYVIGYFDDVAEMERVYDRFAGHRGLKADAGGWRLTEAP